jgi:N-formylglutamate deformylase/formiminoglutamase
MRKIIDDSINSFSIINEDSKLPFVISIPHSGLYITKEMNDNLVDDIILSNSDWYLNELYSFLEELGFTIVINNINRYTIDVNRELVLNNRDNFSNLLIYMKNTFSKDLYKTNLYDEEINDRITKYYQPYHNELEKQINNKLKLFNKVYLIDLHSFGKDLNTDIILGDNNHSTMNIETFKMIRNCFIKNKFTVSDNNPYKGGYITRKYGLSNSECESIQIELSYRQYIDNREFYEEELPNINKTIMNNCQKRLKKAFISIINNTRV